MKEVVRVWIGNPNQQVRFKLRVITIGGGEVGKSQNQ